MFFMVGLLAPLRYIWHICKLVMLIERNLEPIDNEIRGKLYMFTRITGPLDAMKTWDMSCFWWPGNNKIIISDLSASFFSNHSYGFDQYHPLAWEQDPYLSLSQHHHQKYGRRGHLSESNIWPPLSPPICRYTSGLWASQTQAFHHHSQP